VQRVRRVPQQRLKQDNQAVKIWSAASSKFLIYKNLNTHRFRIIKCVLLLK
jgi:hypothetical protein